jgi:hypothetical protein
VSERPAFYALAPGGARDYVTLLHAPYTLWHLSYVAIGASLVPALEARRLLWTLAAFALALGIGAHALDELRGRPLGTAIPARTFVALAAASIGGAVAIGVAAALAWTAWLLPLVAFGAFIVAAYNLELFDGWFHNDVWFAVAWGAFPVLTAYLAAAETIRTEALLAGAAAALVSAAQRVLSTDVRRLRRQVVAASGELELRAGGRIPLTTDTLRATPERALLLLAAGMSTLGLALVTARLL